MIVRSEYTIRRAAYSVALGRIRCFCLSQAGRDYVQQVQETTNSPLCVNGLV